eukprot:gene50268-67319_t
MTDWQMLSLALAALNLILLLWLLLRPRPEGGLKQDLEAARQQQQGEAERLERELRSEVQASARGTRGELSQALGLFQQVLIGLLARRLGQLDVGADTTADQRLQPAEGVRHYIARPHGDAPHHADRARDPKPGQVVGGGHQHGVSPDCSAPLQGAEDEGVIVLLARLLALAGYLDPPGFVECREEGVPLGRRLLPGFVECREEGVPLG